MLYLASEDFLCLHFTVDQLRDMIWKAEEYMAVKIVILILSIFVYFANVLLFLLQLQVFIIIQALVDGFSSFQMVLARFRQSQVVLACFNSFLTLISTKKICQVSLPIPYIRPSPSKGQLSTLMNTVESKGQIYSIVFKFG